jgi:hypothetical protein
MVNANDLFLGINPERLAKLGIAMSQDHQVLPDALTQQTEDDAFRNRQGNFRGQTGRRDGSF